VLADFLPVFPGFDLFDAASGSDSSVLPGEHGPVEAEKRYPAHGGDEWGDEERADVLAAA
jgi:hypothetical protein